MTVNQRMESDQCMNLARYQSSRGGHFTIQVGDRERHTMREGLGTNWFSGWRGGAYPAADDERRWARLFDHLTWLGPRFIRFGQPAKR